MSAATARQPLAPSVAGSKPTRMARPANPTSSPATRGPVSRSSGSTAAASTMTTSGMAPLMTDARVESTSCSAHVMSKNGSATLSTPMTARDAQVRGSRGSRRE